MSHVRARQWTAWGVILVLGVLGTRAAWARVDRYTPVELKLRSSKRYANPYLDVTITAMVTPPAGSGEAAYMIPGFWDGGSTWRVRWAPRKAGTYTLTVTCSDPSNVGLHNKTFTTSARANYSATWAPHGFIGIDPGSQYYLTYDDGTRFYWVGDTNWYNLYATAVSTAHWQTLCDTRARQGFNLLQAVVWNDFEHWLDGHYPFGGPGGTNHDVINPLSWQRMDVRVKYAVQQGLVVYLMTDSNGTHLAWPRSQRDRLYRYVVARYAAYNVAFGGGEELNASVDPVDIEYQHMIRTINALDPYHRLVGLHNHNWKDRDRIVLLVPSDVNILTVQAHNNRYFANSFMSRTYGKPFIFAEGDYYGYSGASEADVITIRRQIWESFMGGAAGHTYGQDYVAYRREGIITADLMDRSAQEIQKFTAWVRQSGLQWWHYTRFEEVGSGRYLGAQPGRQYVIMTETSGDVFTINLADATGTLVGQWYNTATGIFGNPMTRTAGAAVLITPPGPWHILRLDVSPTSASLSHRKVP